MEHHKKQEILVSVKKICSICKSVNKVNKAFAKIDGIQTHDLWSSCSFFPLSFDLIIKLTPCWPSLIFTNFGTYMRMLYTLKRNKKDSARKEDATVLCFESADLGPVYKQVG